MFIVDTDNNLFDFIILNNGISFIQFPNPLLVFCENMEGKSRKFLVNFLGRSNLIGDFSTDYRTFSSEKLPNSNLNKKKFWLILKKI